MDGPPIQQRFKVPDYKTDDGMDIRIVHGAVERCSRSVS